MKNIIYLFIFSFILINCKNVTNCDLIITNGKILDVKSGKIIEKKSIVILNGKIIDITNNIENYKSKQTIDANYKLVTPSFIDTHIHPTDVFGDREKAPKMLDKNSRQKLSNEYLPYGITSTLTLGQPENWIKQMLEWEKNPNGKFTDNYNCGGAIISKENHPPYIGHCVVENSKQAKEKVLEYHKLGIRHIKLYYRLRSPEFDTAYKTADSLKMKIYGHIGDFGLLNIKIDKTLKLGLKNYEHLALVPNNILTDQRDWDKLDKQFESNFGDLNTESKVLEYFLEQFRYIDENKKVETNNFIQKLAENKVSFSTTIHFLYQQFEPTYFTKPKDTSLTKLQTKRCKENFEIFMKYAKLMMDKGIEIRFGSDMANGGKADISELVIMCKYGFSVAEVFKIASLNGAKAIGIENEVGTIEIGKNANLLIWSKNPFDNFENFTANKTIIKDGITYKK